MDNDIKCIRLNGEWVCVGNVINGGDSPIGNDMVTFIRLGGTELVRIGFESGAKLVWKTAEFQLIY